MTGQSHASGCPIKKALEPTRKRQIVDDLVKRFGAPLRKACDAMGLQRSVYYYRAVARDSAAVLMRIKEITQTRVHYGYRREKCEYCAAAARGLQR